MRTKYTDPQISTTGTRWYVWFKFGGRTFKKYGGANYKKLASSERKAELKNLAKAWQIRLNEGYNPITKQFDTTSGVPVSAYAFSNALEFARLKKWPRWKKKTRQDYDSAIRYINEAAEACGLAGTLITEFRRVHYKAILEAVQGARKLSGAGYNKYRDYLSSLVGELVQWEVLEANPLESVKMQQVIKKFAHKPPTPAERVKISDYLQAHHFDFYRFCATLFATTIREKEILALRISDLYLDEQVFRIVPDSEQDNSKIYTEREAIIPDSLLPILLRLNLSAFPKEYYIFSTDFMPGPKRMHSNTPTAIWRRIVKGTEKKPGLGIKKDLYGLKKLGGDIMIDLQMDIQKMIELPQKQMGHTNSDMTEVYVTRHKELMNDLLKRKMPLF